MFWCVLHELLYGLENKYVSKFIFDFFGVVHSTYTILRNPIKCFTPGISPTYGISPVTISILWLRWLYTPVPLVINWLLCNRVLVDSMTPMLLSGLPFIFILRCYQESLYYLYPAAMLRLPMLCAILFYLYSAAMARIFLSASCTTLVADRWYFTSRLYLGVTICHFF